MERWQDGDTGWLLWGNLPANLDLSLRLVKIVIVSQDENKKQTWVHVEEAAKRWGKSGSSTFRATGWTSMARRKDSYLGLTPNKPTTKTKQHNHTTWRHETERQNLGSFGIGEHRYEFHYRQKCKQWQLAVSLGISPCMHACVCGIWFFSVSGVQHKVYFGMRLEFPPHHRGGTDQFIAGRFILWAAYPHLGRRPEQFNQRIFAFLKLAKILFFFFAHYFVFHTLQHRGKKESHSIPLPTLRKIKLEKKQKQNI